MTEKVFCKIDLTITQTEDATRCTGSAHFNGSLLDKAYALFHFMKALDIDPESPGGMLAIMQACTIAKDKNEKDVFIRVPHKKEESNT